LFGGVFGAVFRHRIITAQTMSEHIFVQALDGGEMRWKVPFAIFRLLSSPENMI
jgi:hypothetical protein